jgi:hypothetical protein
MVKVQLIGTTHPLQFDHDGLPVKPRIPKNHYGEAQKFLHQLWVRKLTKQFNPQVLFDEVDLDTVEPPTRCTGYIGDFYPVRVWMDITVGDDLLELYLIDKDEDEFTIDLRERYWLNCITLTLEALKTVERITVICGLDHLDSFPAKLEAAGFVVAETHYLSLQRWHSDRWMELPDD